MKDDWERVPLGEIAELINGRAYKKAELLDAGPYPVLRVGNFFTNRNWYYSDLKLPAKNYCDNGDLLYAWSASFGPRIWDGGKCIFHYHIWKVAPDPHRVSKSYLYHLLDWDKELIKEEQGAGSTMVHVSKRSMEARLVPLPPIEEQQRIVAILDEAFEGLDRAKANAEANLVSARELFRSAMSNALSGDGMWISAEVKETFDSVRKPAKVQRKQYLAQGELPIVSQEADLVSGYWNDPKAVIDEPEPVIVFGDHTRCVKLVDFPFVAGADGTQIMRPKSSFDPLFFYFMIRNIDLEGKGYARHFSHLKKARVSFPKDRQTQEEIARRLVEMESRVAQMGQEYMMQCECVATLRQSLLAKAFAGELT